MPIHPPLKLYPLTALLSLDTFGPTTRCRAAMILMLATGLWPTGALAVDAEPSDALPHNDASQSTPPPIEESTDPCGTGEWKLDGAHAKDDAAQSTYVTEITFQEEWRSAIDQVLSCLQTTPKRQSCVVVQGQYDDRVFNDAIVKTMGSQQSAQLYRAKGRAQAVMSVLLENGVSYQRIIDLPPPSSPTYRGVRIGLMDDCLRDNDTPLTGNEIAKRLRHDGFFVEEDHERSVFHPTVDVTPTPIIPNDPPIRPFWIGVVLNGELTHAERNTLFHGGGRLEAGVRLRRFYARLDFGVAGAPDALVRRTFSTRVAAGGQIRPWLLLGGVAGYRQSAPGFFDTWVVQDWFWGLESAQRLWRNEGRLSLWLGQIAAPFGLRMKRAEFHNDVLYAVSRDSHWQAVFEISLSLRVAI